MRHSATKYHSRKRHSAKRHSLKRHSAKRSSLKRHSAKRHSAKRHSAKRSSPKKSTRTVRKTRVKSHYRMRGMGVLLNMYGGASEALEQEVASKRKELADLNAQLSAEKSEARRQQIKAAMEKVQVGMDAAKEKMKQLLRGAAETAGKAAAALSAGAKVAGAKLSAGLSSFGSKLSSGLSSIGQSFKGKIEDYRDKQSTRQMFAAQAEAEIAKMKALKRQQEYEQRLSRRSSIASGSTTPTSDSDSMSGGSSSYFYSDTGSDGGVASMTGSMSNILSTFKF